MRRYIKMTYEARNFLMAGQQLQENFARLITINNLLKEARIDLTQIGKRMVKYGQLFDKMLNTPESQQDWKRVISELNSNIKELNTYFTWISDVEKYNIQITQQELDTMIAYKGVIQNQVRTLQGYLKD